MGVADQSTISSMAPYMLLLINTVWFWLKKMFPRSQGTKQIILGSKVKRGNYLKILIMTQTSSSKYSSKLP